MRIVNLGEFLSLEGEVLYQKYVPDSCEGLAVKTESVGLIDFCSNELSGEFTKRGGSIDREPWKANFDFTIRDAMFDADQLFLIWEPADVQELIMRLSLLAVPKK